MNIESLLVFTNKIILKTNKIYIQIVLLNFYKHWYFVELINKSHSRERIENILYNLKDVNFKSNQTVIKSSKPILTESKLIYEILFWKFLEQTLKLKSRSNQFKKIKRK